MIPKNIHLIWYQSWDEFPERFHANVRSIIEKNPDYKIFYWDNESMREELKDMGQEYLDRYDSFKLLHQKIDFFRYAVLYNRGGISVDTDVVALKGFDSVPNIETSDLIVSEKPHSKSMNNATILASKNNPILKYLIDNITTPCGENETDYKCIQRTTGPYAFNKILKDFKEDIVVLDKVYMEPCASLDSYCHPSEESVLNHLHELSWLKPWHKNLIKSYFVAKHYKYQILIGIIILIVLILILKRNNN